MKKENICDYDANMVELIRRCKALHSEIHEKLEELQKNEKSLYEEYRISVGTDMTIPPVNALDDIFSREYAYQKIDDLELLKYPIADTVEYTWLCDTETLPRWMDVNKYIRTQLGFIEVNAPDDDGYYKVLLMGKPIAINLHYNLTPYYMIIHNHQIQNIVQHFKYFPGCNMPIPVYEPTL